MKLSRIDDYIQHKWVRLVKIHFEPSSERHGSHVLYKILSCIPFVLIYAVICCAHKINPSHNKTNQHMCAKRRLRLALLSLLDQSLVCSIGN